MPHPVSVSTDPSDLRTDRTAPSPVRQWRRAALSALGDDPRRQPPTVDGYTVGRLLGSGGSSVVWAGTGVDGVERALKVLHPDTDTDLLQELSLLRRVRHPRVVAVHDISTDSTGRPVLVLDLAAGGSLADVVGRRRRLTPGEVSGLLSVLGPALEELHGAGVVHGDIAPGNVLLDSRGEPLLADLGVARALGRSHGSVLGTPGFADPAAVAGEGGVGAASDVYGLASLAWWALTGDTPEPQRALAVRRNPAGSGANTAVLAALRDGLHRKPSRRPTPGELARSVAAVARPRPVRGLPAVDPGAQPQEIAAPPGATRRLPTPAGPVDPELAPAPASARADTAPASRRLPRRADPRRTTGSRRTPRSRRSTRRKVPRLLLVAAALPVVAGGALVVALQAGAQERPSPAAVSTHIPTVAEPIPTPSTQTPAAPAPEAPDVTAPLTDAGEQVLAGDDAAAVVSELADRRARALVSGDPAALDLVDVPGSAAHAADKGVLSELLAAGTRFEALAFDVVAVREVARTDLWVLEADVVTAEHVVVSAAGARTTVPAGEPRTSRLTLERVDGQWRITAVG